jgi:superfamily II DNA or RNA helicase
MPDWSESTLKAASGWKAFKDGKSLFESGQVSQAKSSPDGWTGAVKAGSRLIRHSVKVPAPGHFEVKCSCPENQATGAICAHAVATGLSLVTQRPAATVPTSTSAVAAPPRNTQARADTVPAFSLKLPPNWRDSLSRGRLTVTVAIDLAASPEPADVRLADWLILQGVTSLAKPIPLSLDPARLPGFLVALCDHPNILSGSEPLSLSQGRMLALGQPVREGDHALLKATETIISIGQQFATLSDSGISLLGSGAPPTDLAPFFQDWLSGKSAKIPLKLLLRRAPVWEDWIALPDDSWLGTLRLTPAVPTFELSLDGNLQHLTARLSVRYFDLPPLVPGDFDDPHFPRPGPDSTWQVRDTVLEMEALATLSAAGFSPKDAGVYGLQGETSILSFCAHRLPDLRSRWTIDETPRLQKTAGSIQAVRPKFEVLGSGEDWLAFDYSFQTDAGIEVSRAEVLQWLRSGRASKTTPGGRTLVLDQEATELLDPLLSELDIRQEDGHFIGPKAIEELVSEFRNKSDKSNKTKRSEQFLNPLSATLATGTSELLRPYQRDGIFWLSDRLERFGGALLADDMGLGKTLQTIAAIERVFELDCGESGAPVLIVTPTSLLGNWRAEFQRFAPGRAVRILHGAQRDAERDRIGNVDVIVTSFGTLARDLAWHLGREYRLVAVDEASLMRNPDTDHAKAISKLRSKRRIALSGTPVENGVRDLWSIFRFIQPGWLGTLADFKDRYEAPLQQVPRPRAPLDRLRLKTSPFILRRTKEEVASDLPSKLIIDDYCELSADQRQIYRDILGEGGKRIDEIQKSAGGGAARMQMLTTLLRLRQVCCDLALLKNDRLSALAIERRSSKLERLLERVNEAALGSHRMLVFSQFQTQLQEIQKRLSGSQIDSFLLDGSTRNRQQLVDDFQKPTGPPVFLISLKAGGYGLNLTAADTVVHFDPWWNPAAEAQATDRAHRIGQNRPVTVYRLLTRGTVEEKVVRLQANKRELANATFDESGQGEPVGWSESELFDLLRS